MGRCKHILEVCGQTQHGQFALEQYQLEHPKFINEKLYEYNSLPGFYHAGLITALALDVDISMLVVKFVSMFYSVAMGPFLSLNYSFTDDKPKHLDYIANENRLRPQAVGP